MPDQKRGRPSRRPETHRVMVTQALAASVRRLDPRHMARNPVMFVVEVASIFCTLLWVQALVGEGEAPPSFIAWVCLWLWFTVLFSNFAEALAEGRGKAQAAALRAARADLRGFRVAAPGEARGEWVAAPLLLKGECVRVQAGDIVPVDGEVALGAASVDESAITGESAPVIREAGGDRSSVTAGTRVLSDVLWVTVAAEAGGSFLDQMIAMVEGAKRQKTPNEIALAILLAGLTLVFLVGCATLLPFSGFAVLASGQGRPVSLTALTALLVCLVPSTIGGLLGAIGIAGMDRLMSRGVVATSGRAVEAAGDVDVLLLDKTGTITLGNRRAVSLLPAPGISPHALAEAALLSSLADSTPEGRSITTLASELLGRGAPGAPPEGAEIVPFSASTRMSGLDVEGRALRKGATDAVARWLEQSGGAMPGAVLTDVDTIARSGGTPLVVAEGGRVLGVVHLKDVVKAGIKERFAELRRMGIRTVMITGDNPRTAAAIAAEAGVDEFMAEATPEAKLARIRAEQAAGHRVAMTGDGTNDAPALAQADVAVAMNSGTQAAREAANMVDLDSDPTKLIDVVHTGKQLLMTRGALTTFSLANDVAKYFAILPAAFAATWPQLGALDLMGLSSPESAILSAVIFNALVIVALIPLALKGVRWSARPAHELLRDNLLVYGLGGLITPFVGIGLIDRVVSSLGLVG